MKAPAPTTLRDAVDRFVAETTPGASRPTAGRGTSRCPDPRREARGLARAVIDLDGMHTDEQLDAYLATFGPPADYPGADAGELRRSGHVRTARTWLHRPSDLFCHLVDVDATEGTDHAWRYHDRAMEIVAVLTELDGYLSPAEERGIRTWRDMLVTAITDAGITRRSPDATTAGVAEDARSLEDLLSDLDDLIGLDTVKEQIRLVSDLVAVHGRRAERGFTNPDTSHHLVFTGNPGTGKTTVARLVAGIYRELGVVSRGHLVETDRAGLVAGYVGQTAGRVDEVVDSALGGVLLIDEAYSLVRGGTQDFGREALDALVKRMEDHRDDLVVIAAGYPDEMDDFLDANPGLRSRFGRVVHFADYDVDELVGIFELLCRNGDYRPEPTAVDAVRARVAAVERGRGFGNGRYVRSLFERAMARHARRVAHLGEWTDDDLVVLTVADVTG